MIKAIGDCVFKSLCILAVIVSACVLLKGFVTLPPDPDAAWKANYGSQVYYEHRDVCWTGEAKADVPTHVIVRTADREWEYKGRKWVDIALNDVFKKDDPNVFVYAFCK